MRRPTSRELLVDVGQLIAGVLAMLGAYVCWAG